MSDTFDHEGDAIWDQLFGRGVGPREPLPGGVQCNRCKRWGLRWRQQSGRWVLFESKAGVEHVCVGPASPDEFD